MAKLEINSNTAQSLQFNANARMCTNQVSYQIHYQYCQRSIRLSCEWLNNIKTPLPTTHKRNTPEPRLVDIGVPGGVEACQVLHEELASVEDGLVGEGCKECAIVELPAVPVHC